MPSHPRVVVCFDLDGTLWDSLPGIVGSLAHTLEVFGLPVPAHEVLAADIGGPLIEMLVQYGVAPERAAEGVEVYRDRYRRLGEFECELFDGAIELLDRLRADGVVLATATSKGVEPTRRMLAHFDLDHRFDAIAAAPMLGTHSKADVIAEALELVGSPAPETTTMVGDRSYDIEGGRSHGLRTIGVAWGYGGPDELSEAGADLVVGTFDELATALTSS